MTVFKENTNDTRESPALIFGITKRRCYYDPKVRFEQIKNDLAQEKETSTAISKIDNWEFCEDLYEVTIEPIL